jgi:hypothetical protein
MLKQRLVAKWKQIVIKRENGGQNNHTLKTDVYMIIDEIGPSRGSK